MPACSTAGNHGEPAALLGRDRVRVFRTVTAGLTGTALMAAPAGAAADERDIAAKYIKAD